MSNQSNSSDTNQPEFPNIPERPTTPEAGNSLFDNLVESENRSSLSDTQDVEEAEHAMALASFTAGNLDFDTSELVIPRIRLAQGLTQEVQEGTAKAGQFLITGLPPMDTITVIPGFFARRRLFANAETQEIQCRSADSIVGVGIPGGVCEECPNSKWTGSQEEKNRKGPVCTFMFSYIVFIVEWETLGILDFKKTSLNAGKVVNTMASRFGLLSPTNPQAGFAVTLKSNAQTNPQKQRYYVMSVVPAKVDAEVLSTARQFMQLGM